MHVDCRKTGGVERSGHFDLAVDALLAQHRHARAFAAGDEGRSDVGLRVEAQRIAQPRIGRIPMGGVFLLGAGRVVAQFRHFITGARPGALQVGARLVEEQLAVAQHAHAVVAH